MVVVRAGQVAEAALHAMLSGGLREFVLLDTGETRWSPAIVACLKRAWPDARIDLHDPPSLRMSAPWAAGCAVCLLCADVIDAPTALRVNARCVRAGVIFVPALLRGAVGQVGPVVKAGASACLHCVDLRLAATTGRSCFGSAQDRHPSRRLARSVGREQARRVIQLLAQPELEPAPEWRQLSIVREDGSVTSHVVLPTWHCPACSVSGRQPAFQRPSRAGPSSADPHQGDERRLCDGAGLVDPVTGPLRTLTRYEVSGEDPAVRHWVAALADPGWSSFGLETLWGGGNRLDDASARAASVGEALDRLSGCLPQSVNPLVRPYREVADDAIDPRAWDLFEPATRAESGFPYATIGPDDPISWVWGWSLTASRPVLVPASRVFVAFRPRTAGDCCDHPTVSGFATGTTVEAAALAGLLEVIERDTFMIAWANRLSLPRLTLRRWSPSGVGQYVAAFEDKGFELRCGALQLDLGAPVVVAMVRSSRANDPACVLAAGCALELADGCRKALAELSANRLAVRHEMRTHSRLPSLDSVTHQRDHGLLYARADMARHLAMWWDGPETVDVPATSSAASPGAELRRLVAQIDSVGLETILVDVTSPEAAECALSTVKVLVPGTYPVTFGARWPHLGGHRLRSVPVVAGRRPAPLPFEALNRTPHPFP